MFAGSPPLVMRHGSSPGLVRIVSVILFHRVRREMVLLHLGVPGPGEMVRVGWEAVVHDGDGRRSAGGGRHAGMVHDGRSVGKG